jgi:hypothetical protein
LGLPLFFRYSSKSSIIEWVSGMYVHVPAS